MTCEHASAAELSGYADGELPAKQQRWWEQHLAACPACRAELGRLRTLSASLKRDLPPREPSSAFREELRQLLRSEPAGRPRAPAPLPPPGAPPAARPGVAAGGRP